MFHLSRRTTIKAAAGLLGMPLHSILHAKEQRGRAERSKAKSCIIVYCWGGMSHHEGFDPKPDASSEIRGEFNPTSTATPGIHICEHLPRMAQLTNKLAIIRSMHHDDSAHGRGMYWNMTGHKPPRAGNIPPVREDWPSLAAMISEFRTAPRGAPRAVRLPYPMVDNGTLQAGEYGGWLGVHADPIVMKTPAGKPWKGVSRTLGAEVLELGSNVDLKRIGERHSLLRQLERPTGGVAEFKTFDHYRALASDMMLSSGVKTAYDLEKENPKIRERYGDHIGGQSLLLARRLIEAGVPTVQVICSAGDLNGGSGDMWDTHANNFNRLKNDLLPVFDQAASALLTDLQSRGLLDETLVVFLTEFGRTPKINGSAGRDHYPSVYSVALAGGGIRGGQVYGSSDLNGAFPKSNATGPADLHATIFQALGIDPHAQIFDQLGRPFPVSDGKVLPLS